MVILSFDIATKTGFAAGTKQTGVEERGSFSCKSYVEGRKRFRELMDKWKPDIVITAMPTRHYNVTRKLSEITGVMLVEAEARGIKVEKNLVDSSCKKAVIGKGNAKKPEICAYFNEEDEDAADAMMFFTYWVQEKL